MDFFNILIVEDDISTCQRFAAYADTKNDIKIVNMTNNSAQAIKDIEFYRPDAIILDLELHHGGGSGLDVLSKIDNIGYKPYILVTTNNSSAIRYEYARELGADYIKYKHEDSYSEKAVVDFLYSMKNIIKNNRSCSMAPLEYSPAERSERIDLLIEQKFNELGLKPRYAGYLYLRDAVHMLIDGTSKNISSIIGKKYKKNDSNIERAMQYAINATWNHVDIETLLANYTEKLSRDKSCPTTTEFIYYYARELKKLI